MEVHVISKSDNSKHASFTLETAPGELAASSVRVKVELISLTSNNLSYARGGTVLHWWDAYPVPSSAPFPYNDASSWGIVPAWGFATVLETTTSIPVNTLLYGFWPTSSIPVDLQLEASDIAGQYIETSLHRKSLMTVYGRYFVLPTPFSKLTTRAVERLAWESLFRPVWQTGHLLSQYVFPALSQPQSPVHPLGMGGPWTQEDADLRTAVLVNLSASSKTGRSFAFHLSRREKGHGPLGLLQVSSIPDILTEVEGVLKSPFEMLSVGYEGLSSRKVMDFISGLNVGKVVIVDNGARAGTIEKFLDAIKQNFKAKTVILQVGSEQKIYTSDDLRDRGAEMQALSKIQVNTSTVRDTVLRSESLEEYYANAEKRWEEWQDLGPKIVPDLKVAWGKGVSGERGIEEGWTKLCASQVGADEGLVYRL